MSDESIQSLLSQLTKVNGESANRRTKNNQLKKQIEDLQTQVRGLETLTRERDDWKAKAEAKPGEELKRVTELEGKLREITHKGEFAKLAKLKHKDITESQLDDAWELSKYKPESDTPDPVKLKEAVETLATSKPHLFTPLGTQTSNPPATPPALPPGPGVRRGDPAPLAGDYVVRYSDAANPGFMARNSKAIAEAREAGTLKMVSD